MEQKFGRKLDDAGGMRDMIRARAADVGVTMTMSEDSRVYNSFDAHRLLHWAGLEASRSRSNTRCSSLFHREREHYRP